MKKIFNASNFVLLVLLALYAEVIRMLFRYDVLSIPRPRLFQTAMDLFSMSLGLILFLTCRSDKDERKGLKKWYLVLVVTVYVGLFSDAAAWLVDALPDKIFVNIAMNTILFMCAPLILIEFLFYILEYLDMKEKRGVRNICKAMWAGCFFAMLARVVNLFYPIYFWVDADGVYQRGKLFLISNIYAYVGGILIIVLLLMYRREMEGYQLFILLAFILVPLAAVTFSVFFYGGTPGFPATMTVLQIFYCILNLEKSRSRSMIDAELSLATKIQENMLPNVFPAFPERDEFDLYASMTPAKEVGGDFYDFFLIDKDHLGLVIADVSGKGVPGAMFTMYTKNVIADNVMQGKSPSEALFDANNIICANNPEEMFVTVWLGILTISTGRLVAANAGHEYPIVRRHFRKKFRLFEDEHGFAVGWFPNSVFNEYEIMMEPGDKLFLYTDGVAEATADNGEMFGMDRAVDILSSNIDSTAEQMIESVKSGVDDFVRDAEQFDDLTMLALVYNG